VLGQQGLTCAKGRPLARTTAAVVSAALPCHEWAERADGRFAETSRGGWDQPQRVPAQPQPQQQAMPAHAMQQAQQAPYGAQMAQPGLAQPAAMASPAHVRVRSPAPPLRVEMP